MAPSCWRLKRSNISLFHWAHPGFCPVISASIDTKNQGCCIFLSGSEHNATVKCNRMKSQKVRRRPGSCHSYHPKVRSCHTYTHDLFYRVIVILVLVVPILITYQMEPVYCSSSLWCFSKHLIAAWTLWCVTIVFSCMKSSTLKKKKVFLNKSLKTNVARSSKMAYSQEDERPTYTHPKMMRSFSQQQVRLWQKDAA